MSDKEPKPNKKPINDANPIHPPRVQIASHAVEEHTHMHHNIHRDDDADDDEDDDDDVSYIKGRQR